MTRIKQPSTFRQSMLTVLGSILALGSTGPQSQTSRVTTSTADVTLSAAQAQAQKGRPITSVQSSVPGSALRGLLAAGDVPLTKGRPKLSGLEIRAVRMSAGRSSLPTARRMQARRMIRKSQNPRPVVV